MLMGMKSLLKDLGYDLGGVLEIDSSAAKGIATRQGIGRIRHLHTSLLWIQQAVHDKLIRVVKILGTENTADMGTKHLDQKLIQKFMIALNCRYEAGQSKLALKAALNSLSLSRATPSCAWH